MNYTNYDKKLFFEVFGSKGKNSWTLAYKKKYVYTVQKQSDVSNKTLPENIVKEEISKIFELITKYDEGLKIFKEFLKSHELYARKSIEIYNLELSRDVKSKTSSIKDIAYKYDIPKGWTPIEFSQSNNEITITLAKGAYHSSNIKLDDEKLEKDLWEKLSTNVLDLTANKYSTLKSIKTELMEETRVISKVKFDINNNTLELGMDYTYIQQEDAKKITKEQQEKDKKIIANEISELLNLPKKTTEQIKNSFENQENSIFTKETFEKLFTLKQNDLIIIPTTHHFYKEDKVNDEHNEDIITSQKNQKLLEIEKKIKEYYTLKGTLSGFFIKFPEHDTAKAYITEQLLDEAETTKFYAFAILVRPMTSFEKNSNNGKMENKTIDSIIFDFDIFDKKLNIKNNNYTKEIYETIISKVLEFSKSN